MDEIQNLERRVQKEVFLKDYKGEDRVIYAEDKRRQILEEAKIKPPFRAMVETIPTLNWCTEGFRTQQLVVVSGPPKAGKTELCSTFTVSFIKEGKKCVWFPFEGMYEELFVRFPFPDILDFYLPNKMERGRIEWVEDRIIEAKEKYGAEVVFIDNLDFLCDPKAVREMNKIATNYSTYVGSIVQEVKEIAVEHNVLIFLMSHITKNRWGNNKLPTAEDLRDTGKTAQLADMVLMVIRERSSNKDSDVIYEGTNAFLGVMENRLNGRTKRIPIQLSLEKRVFIEIDKTYAHEGGNENYQGWTD